MIKNLETADLIAKFALAVATVVLFLAGAIAGPFARLLALLSAAVIAISLAKILTTLLRRHRP